jgi:hypothetical protein
VCRLQLGLATRQCTVSRHIFHMYVLYVQCVCRVEDAEVWRTKELPLFNRNRTHHKDLIDCIVSHPLRRNNLFLSQCRFSFLWKGGGEGCKVSCEGGIPPPTWKMDGMPAPLQANQSNYRHQSFSISWSKFFLVFSRSLPRPRSLPVE